MEKDLITGKKKQEDITKIGWVELWWCYMSETKVMDTSQTQEELAMNITHSIIFTQS